MLEDVVGHVDRVHEVPPGVDVDEFVPEPRDAALAALIEEAQRDDADGGERHPDRGNAARFATFFADDAPTVLYFGKLIENKGVQVLFEALHGLDARAVIVGFGDYREELEAARSAGHALHRRARAPAPRASAAARRRRRRAVDLPRGVRHGCGRGRRGRRAAGRRRSLGARRGRRRHRRRVPARAPRALVAFPNGDAAVLRDRLRTLLELPPAERRALGLAARRAVERSWSWPRVAERLLEPFVD